MPDETVIITKDGVDGKQSSGPNGSSMFNVSIRAWIALTITLTVCLCFIFNMVMATFGYTSVNFTIGEPLYGAFGLVLGLYFGQKK